MRIECLDYYSAGLVRLAEPAGMSLVCLTPLYAAFVRPGRLYPMGLACLCLQVHRHPLVSNLIDVPAALVCVGVAFVGSVDASQMGGLGWDPPNFVSTMCASVCKAAVCIHVRPPVSLLLAILVGLECGPV